MCSTWALWAAVGGGVFIMLCMSSVLAATALALLPNFSPMGAARAYSAPQGQQRGTPTETQQLSSRMTADQDETMMIKWKMIRHCKTSFEEEEDACCYIFKSQLQFQSLESTGCFHYTVSRRKQVCYSLHPYLHISFMKRSRNMTFKRENVLSLCLMKDWEELLVSVW